MADSKRYSRQEKWSNQLRALWRKRFRAAWLNYHWPLIWSLGIAAMILGAIGFQKLYADSRSALDVFYLSLQLFLLESGAIDKPISWELEVARLLAPAIAGYTATRALAVIFKEQLRQFRMHFISNHLVICGLGRMGSLLAKTFHDRGYKVVVIEKDAENDNLDHCREHGALAFAGNATDPHVLRMARVHRAKLLISVCGNDGTNAEVSMHARALVRGRKEGVLTCLVHIFDLNLCRLLREKEIATHESAAFRLEFFNVFESGARAMLDEYPVLQRAADAPHSCANLLVVGLGRMGESLVVRAARQWQQAHRKSKTRLKITVIDRDAQRRSQTICLKYPQVEKVCELRPIQADIYSPEFQRAGFLFDKRGGCPLTTIYVCVDNDTVGLAAALTLLQRIRDRKIPIVVRMTQASGLTALLRGDRGNGNFENLHAFGLLSRTCKPDLLLGGTHEILARAIHEDYVHHQEQLGQTPKTNPSMVAWEQLPEHLKESNRRQSDHIGLKLKAAGCAIAPLTDWDAGLFEFTLEEIEKMAKMEYERWNEERRLAGWKFADDSKDLKKKTTPHLTSWEELEEKVKDLDRNTVRGLPRFLASAGFQIYRMK